MILGAVCQAPLSKGWEVDVLSGGQLATTTQHSGWHGPGNQRKCLAANKNPRRNQAWKSEGCAGLRCLVASKCSGWQM